MLRRFAIAVFAFALGASAWAGPPKAQNGREQMSLESAVQQVQQQTSGRILSADSVQNGRNKLYRIKVLTPDGHVKVMQLHSNDTPAGSRSARDRKRGGSGDH